MNCTPQLGLPFFSSGLLDGPLKTNVKRHNRIASFFQRERSCHGRDCYEYPQNPWSLKCRRIKTRTISRISKAAKVASRAAAASRSPISKISSRPRSRVRADSKAVNRADSRIDNQSPTLRSPPSAQMLGVARIRVGLVGARIIPAYFPARAGEIVRLRW